MPIPVETPVGLRPFEAHGLDFHVEPSGNALADCPFCAKEGKFSVKVESGEWRCLNDACMLHGNAITFLRKLHEFSWSGKDDYEELQHERGLLHPETLYKWGICRSIISNEWIVPAYNGEGNLSQLYHYSFNPHKGKHVLYATPKLTADSHDITHGLFGAHLYDFNRVDVHIVEGIWNAMAEWEVLGKKINILATPGCNVFFESWVSRYFKDRRVTILYDNDHAKVNQQTQNVEESRSYLGVKRTAGVLKGVASSHKPESMRYLKWGEDGYDKKLPSGYDLRDVLTKDKPDSPQSNHEIPLKHREQRLHELFKKLEPVPDAWPAVKLGSEELTCLPCTSWKDLLDAWEKAMYMTDGLRKALAVLMASALSTEMIGEQIWVRLIGRPSSGKTTLCEAMTVTKRYVKAISVFSGFHSGYKTDKDGEEDYSLIPHIKGKTFIIKDGDTLMQAMNREKIMAELRDIYDGTSRAHYRHGLQRNYEDIRTTIILSGTTTLRELDASECGGRYIDCIVMDKIDHIEERKIGIEIVKKAWANGKIELNGKVEKRDDAHKIRAKRMTGGYVEYLRQKGGKLAKAVTTPEEYAPIIFDCGVLVAYMRSRPSEVQDEVAEREFSMRLAIQYSRLSLYLAAAMGKTIVDKEIIALVRQVAIDTCKGKTLDIADILYPKGMEGLPFHVIKDKRGGREDDLKDYLRYLKDIDVCESFYLTTDRHLKGELRWRLSPYVRDLYTRVIRNQET